MNTIGELIQRVQSGYSEGVQSDDSRLTNRHIYNKLLTSRSRLLSDISKKRQKINQWNYQTLPCVELIQAPLHECPCIPPSGCTILRTKYRLPKPLSNYDKHLIQSVTSLEGDTIFSEISWENKKYKNSNKYTAKKPDYFIRDKYLYITVITSLQVVSITGIFQDPMEVYDYPSFCEEDCTDCEDCSNIMDRDFPIDGEDSDVLVQMAVEELLTLFGRGKEDVTNNTIDNKNQENA